MNACLCSFCLSSSAFFEHSLVIMRHNLHEVSDYVDFFYTYLGIGNGLVSREVAPPAEEQVAAKHEGINELMVLGDDSDEDGHDDDGDFQELPEFKAPTKVAPQQKVVETAVNVTGPVHFPAEVFEDPLSKSDPWASASSTFSSASAPSVPPSWNYEFTSQTPVASTETAAPEIN